MDWEAAKTRLSMLAARHHGRATDFGRLVELAPPAGAERIRVTCAGDRSVRIEAGWFLCRTLDVGDDDRHLLDVVTAVMTGGAREFVVLDDGVPAGDGYLIEYAGGALAARREPHSSDVVERAVPAWRAAHTDTDVRVVPSTLEEADRLLIGARAAFSDRLQRHRGLGREDADARAAAEVAASCRRAPPRRTTSSCPRTTATSCSAACGPRCRARTAPDRRASTTSRWPPPPAAKAWRHGWSARRPRPSGRPASPISACTSSATTPARRRCTSGSASPSRPSRCLWSCSSPPP